MKKSTKAALIAASILVIAGVIMLASAMVISGGKLSALNPEDEYEEKTYTVAASEVSGIVLSDVYRNVRLAASADELIHISYYENANEQYQIKRTADGALTVRYEQKKRLWHNLLRLNLSSWGAPGHDVTIMVPVGFSGGIEAAAQSGNISAEDLAISGNFAAATVSGSIAVRNLQAGSIDLRTASGDIGVEKAVADGYLELASTSGRIAIDQAVASGGCSLVNTSGDMELGNVTVPRLRAQTVSGDIDFTRLVAEDIDLSATSGRITGSVLGAMDDYAIGSRVVSGESNLPRTTQGTKKLKAASTSGDIFIEFIE